MNMLLASALTVKALKGLAVRRHLPEAWGLAGTTWHLTQDGGLVLCGRMACQCEESWLTIAPRARTCQQGDIADREKKDWLELRGERTCS
jgi:hypothetical protein